MYWPNVIFRIPASYIRLKYGKYFNTDQHGTNLVSLRLLLLLYPANHDQLLGGFDSINHSQKHYCGLCMTAAVMLQLSYTEQKFHKMAPLATALITANGIVKHQQKLF